jgi:hypothetical protein
MFAWKPVDMPGVPRELIKHSLDVSKTTKPINQNLQRFAQDKKEVIRVEVNWLLVTGFIKEVYHSEWLANMVLVRKKIMNGGCALITLVSTNTALRTPLACLV